MITPRLTHLTAQTLRWRFALPGLVLLCGVYLAALHPWLMSCGATSREQQAALPGDELAAGPVTYFTRAITIDAPDSEV